MKSDDLDKTLPDRWRRWVHNPEWDKATHDVDFGNYKHLGYDPAPMNQAEQNYAAFCDFVNAFKAQGMNPGEAPTVFHIDLRARGHKVTLTAAPGELVVNVRSASATKKTLKQRFLNLFRR